jgi:hypothetical protein
MLLVLHERVLLTTIVDAHVQCPAAQVVGLVRVEIGRVGRIRAQRRRRSGPNSRSSTRHCPWTWSVIAGPRTRATSRAVHHCKCESTFRHCPRSPTGFIYTMATSVRPLAVASRVIVSSNTRIGTSSICCGIRRQRRRAFQTATTPANKIPDHAFAFEYVSAPIWSSLRL